ncbi:MAG: low-specificity L-threonine aldolase [Deltaproteobacteria bacterium HGW-Deltaproteobacteria-15]|jgi:threonine aldolase|nr:MAG: low-specificity L-threonine aldolase [Deltaproteobacteria bacterium HGW-Deltaproteobacteria-15]
MRIVDLRSDTVTRPTPAMYKAMSTAEVGDDVFGEDPTVNRLQEMAAEMTGKEAALFVASGTMGNLVSQLSQCGRGDEIIVGDKSHIFLLEQGGSAALGGIHARTVPNMPDGTMPLAEIEAAIRTDNIHFPITRLIAIENTHNRCCGSPLPVAYMKQVGDLARRTGLKVHLDGARLFNAAVALGVRARELAADADSVNICLSKGLAAPVGSLVCGSLEFIARAKRARKVVGGGMRQAGVLAAAGIVALTEMIDRLADDHANAKRLAEGIAEVKGISLKPETVKTDIVIFDLVGIDAPTLTARVGEAGVRVLATGPRQIRAVTNYHITADDIDHAIRIFRKAMADLM